MAQLAAQNFCGIVIESIGLTRASGPAHLVVFALLDASALLDAYRIVVTGSKLRAATGCACRRPRRPRAAGLAFRADPKPAAVAASCGRTMFEAPRLG